MYESFEGLLSYLSPEYGVIEVGGIGYKIFIPISLFATLCVGETVKFFTSLVVREDDMKLFGFISRGDRELFELLISLSGIGAKTAVSIIGHMSRNDLYGAIEGKNLSQLCKIPGIGKKSAERLIVELKDRIHPDTTLPLEKGKDFALIEDAKIALVRLGYHQKVAELAIKKAMDGAKEETTLPKLITTALKHV